MKKLNTKTTLILAGILFLAGCSFTEVGQKLDEGVDYVESKYTEEDKEKAKELLEKGKEKSKEVIGMMAEDLSNFQMNQIDEWIEENDLNEYGDPLNTLYTGGTPLFNEATGEVMDKYEYIIDKHPELVEKFGL